MAKHPKWGVNLYHKRTKKKRPGRHIKKRNKKNTYKKTRGQGKK
tara:strand:+ start:267 stop:398 length:132 start_codon:yes stop_codon:yes gene_type:complete